MVAPFKVKLTIYKGSTFRFLATMKNGTPPAATDLTGCTARMHVRSETGSSIILLALTTENGGITLGGAAGTISLFASATATAALVGETGVYDLEMIMPNGDVVRRMYGTVVLSPEVTR